MTRDMSKKQFVEAMHKNGFERDYMGYWRIVGTGTCIYPPNGGNKLRDQLAWAIKQKERSAQ